MSTIYLDNAATSFPKPEGVSEAMVRYLTEVGAPLNRSAYQNAQEAELVALSLRERLKRFFQFPEKCSVFTVCAAFFSQPSEIPVNIVIALYSGLCTEDPSVHCHYKSSERPSRCRGTSRGTCGRRDIPVHTPYLTVGGRIVFIAAGDKMRDGCKALTNVRKGCLNSFYILHNRFRSAKNRPVKGLEHIMLAAAADKECTVYVTCCQRTDLIGSGKSEQRRYIAYIHGITSC